MTTTQPDPKTMQRLAEFVARCKRAREGRAPVPPPLPDAPAPPTHWQDDTEKETAP